MVGTGVVIRDFEGEVIADLTERTTMPTSVVEIEALACRRAISFAAEIGLRDVVIEGDSEIIFKLLTSDSTCLASFGNLLEDAKFAAQAFHNCSFSHVKRNGNSVADKLAKLAKHAIVPQIWLEDIHSDATYLVSIDKSLC
nr:hypothetical protein CFP56_05249 [Quercus suber]